MRGLLVDYGGVLTTNVFDAFSEFCEDEGLAPDTIRRAFRESPEVLGGVRALETGELSEEEFGQRLGGLIGLAAERRDGLLDRMFGHLHSDEVMLAALRRARLHGIRTGLISNSMAFPELFDGVVISAEVGMHKPQPGIYLLGCERIGLEPPECVFVDDLRENCEGAEAAGMTAVLHRGAEDTLPRLEELLGVELRQQRA
jgi:putative hydrolase of the HAD superfamily